MRFCESCIKTVQAVSAKPIGLGYRYFNLQRTAKVNSPYKGVHFQLKMVSYRWEKPKRAPAPSPSSLGKVAMETVPKDSGV